MPDKNARLTWTGAFLIALGIAFFLFFFSIASKPNDPVKLLRTVGAVSGVLSAVGVSLILAGRFRKGG